MCATLAGAPLLCGRFLCRTSVGQCRTVGLSECRSVGNVGIMSDLCRESMSEMSDRGSGPAPGSLTGEGVCRSDGHRDAILVRGGPGHRTLARNDIVVALRECVIGTALPRWACVRERGCVPSPSTGFERDATHSPAVSMSPSRVHLVVSWTEWRLIFSTHELLIQP
jgi:hypothetical protein